MPSFETTKSNEVKLRKDAILDAARVSIRRHVLTSGVIHACPKITMPWHTLNMLK